MTCALCPHHCTLGEGQTGLCRARANRGGQIVCLNAGQITALALDPIEKKPLRRFHPGSRILSVGSFGCNMRCPFCQNSDISMADEHSNATPVSPQALVEQALALREKGNIGIAFTYNEPLIGFEFVLETAILAHREGLLCVLVTNGMVCEAPLAELLPYIDAMNIDLKGFTPDIYQRLGGDFEAVRAAIRQAVKACHVEITTLVVPQLSDRPADMEAEALWLSQLNPELPLHISRFFPRYLMADCPTTPLAQMVQLRDIAARHLRHVYLGNMP